MKERIERLRALAEEARKQYNADLAAGGEPVYPAWIDDLLAVCRFAEKSVGMVSA
jgi:hypothetical protein